jgi:hypothetical protein
MTRALLPEFDVDETVSLEFDTSEVPALQDDLTNERAQKIELWKSQVITRNEIRTDFGYAELDDESGAELYAPASPFGMLPVGGGNDSGAEDGAQRFHGNLSVVESAAKIPIPAHLNGNSHHPDFAWSLNHTYRMQRLPPDTRAAVASAARDEYEALMRRGAPELRRFWKEQGERVVSATRSSHAQIQYLEGRTRAIQETRDIAAIDWNAEEDLLREVLKTIQSRATRAGWMASANQGIPASAYDVANPYVQTVLDEVGTRVVGINQTTMSDVQGVVGKALNEGVSMDELAGRLKGLFEETYTNRALTVARTESQVAYNLGTVAAGKDSGVVDYAELMDNSEHTDDYGASDGLSCAQRDGLIVPLDSVPRHVEAEHPNGTLSVALVVNELE